MFTILAITYTSYPFHLTENGFLPPPWCIFNKCKSILHETEKKSIIKKDLLPGNNTV
jgi:hypothetical protein